MVFPQKLYDILKWVAMVLLPALGAFYGGLSGVWGLPFAVQVVSTIALVDTLLGALLGISSATYKRSDARFDGTMNVLEKDPSVLVNELEITTDPEQMAKQNEIILKVNKVDVPLPSPPRS